MSKDLKSICAIYSCSFYWSWIYTVTRGGPGGSTYVLGYNIWKTAFYQNQLGLAGAMSVIMIIIATILAFILVRIMKGLLER